MKTELILGLQPPPLTELLGAPLQPALAEPLARLADAARAAGFEPAIASGYRSFERQLAIFNGKARGQRPLLDGDGQPLRAAALAPDALLHAILRWSALPGCSRHHWGTDFDIFDQAVCTPAAPLQLTLAECQGPMAPFHQWLTAYLASCTDFGRPYLADRGGVAPEPWHLSYRPLADDYCRALTEAAVRDLLTHADIELKPQLLAQLPALLDRYGPHCD